LSSPSLTKANLRVVRVRCGDQDPAGPGLRTSPVKASIEGTVGLSEQPIHPGSYASFGDRPSFQAARDQSFG
ncbi:hypothetical protein, partial [Stenotrophomonas maltophilia]|uniref:hypothetical protein n=1 Tax=Stenotrophomonas maltophilia TaxID=40324 RepID=UPI001953CA6B